MKAVEKHLYSRNGYFYYRSALPRHLHSVLPMREVVIALGSQDIGEARLMAVRLNYEETRLLRAFLNEIKALSPKQPLDPLIEQFISQIEALKNSVGYKPPEWFEPVNGKMRKGSAGKVRFSEIVVKYLEDCSSDATSTRFQKEATFTMFKEIEGDLSLKEIGIENARHFKTCLMKIPANAKKLMNISSFEGIDWDKISTGNHVSLFICAA